MAAAERRTSPEAAARAEIMGRRTHEAITGMATDLLATPEFMDALGRSFFRRSRDHWNSYSSNEIPTVYFTRGGFGYLVEWRNSRFQPRSHGEPERQQQLVSSGLTVTKYDPEAQTDGWQRKIAELKLRSDYMVDKHDEIARFVDGDAKLEKDFDLEESWENPKSWRNAKSKAITVDEEVFDKIPTVFDDLHQGPARVRI